MGYILSLLMLVCLGGPAFAGEKAPAGSIDVYKYWPWTAGTEWKYKEMRKGFLPSRLDTVKALAPADGASIRVQWPGGWLDHYNETGKGLERPKDFDAARGIYGVYTPPAVQYPHYARLGEPYRRTAMRREFYSADGKPVGPESREDMTYAALGFEDVKVPAGLFKDCLMQIRDYKDVNDKGVERRKIVISWNAPGVGPVRSCVREFSEGRIIEDFCVELTGVSGPAK